MGVPDERHEPGEVTEPALLNGRSDSSEPSESSDSCSDSSETHSPTDDEHKHAYVRIMGKQPIVVF